MTSAVSHISSRAIQVVVGIDTHQDQHVAVAVDQLGIRLNEYSTPQPLGDMENSNDGPATWDRSAHSVSKGPVPTARESHAS